MKKYIVIGASAAGIGTLTKLRQLDKESKIICIDAEKTEPYNKCLIADFLSGQIKEEKVFTKDFNFFKDNNITLHSATRVTTIIPEQNKVKLSNNTQLEYDKLFIGTGTSSFIPNITGVENCSQLFTFQTLCDAHKILEFIKSNNVKNATIVGSGLSGVECADSISSLGIKVNLIERQNKVLPSLVDEGGSQVIEKLLAKNNITFYKNETLREIRSDKTVPLALSSNEVTSRRVRLESGKQLTTEMVIFAVGSKPNIKIAQDAGIIIQDGAILTNDKMQTNIENIYAGGDVCLVKDIITKKYVKSCTWPDAVMQGMVAASNMAGVEKKYPGVLITISSKIFGITFVSCGPVINPSAFAPMSLADMPRNCIIKIKEGTNFYHKFLTQDEKLIGFLMVGNVDNVGKLKNQILKKESFSI